MPWNGSGTFTREHNWVSDRDNDIKITAPRHDEEDNNLANGIQTCLTKTGENSPTANLPMAGQRHTGVGNAAARTDYAAAGQVQDGSTIYAADSGSADTYAITLSPSITSYTAGAEFRFKAANTNTGASTLNVNGQGAKDIRKNGTKTLTAGDIVSGAIITVVYDGTVFQMRHSSTVQDYGGTARRAGYIPAGVALSSSRSMDAADIGHILPATAEVTYTVETGIGDDESIVQIVTDEAITIAEGTGVTLTLKDGGGGATGNFDVAADSVVTLVRRASGAWNLFGNGITGA